jgi:hypothetical protein
MVFLQEEYKVRRNEGSRLRDEIEKMRLKDEYANLRTKIKVRLWARI